MDVRQGWSCGVSKFLQEATPSYLCTTPTPGPWNGRLSVADASQPGRATLELLDLAVNSWTRWRTGEALDFHQKAFHFSIQVHQNGVE